MDLWSLDRDVPDQKDTLSLGSEVLAARSSGVLEAAPVGDGTQPLVWPLNDPFPNIFH